MLSNYLELALRKNTSNDPNAYQSLNSNVEALKSISNEIKYWSATKNSSIYSFYWFISAKLMPFGNESNLIISNLKWSNKLQSTIYNELNAKISALVQARNEIAENIGLIFTKSSSIAPSAPNNVQQENEFYKKNQEKLMAFNKLSQTKPNFIQRYWLPFLMGVGGMWYGSRIISAIDIENLIAHIIDIKLAISNLFHTYILSPALEIWKTIRYNQSKIALTSAKSLESDIQSLERMVSDFAVDTANTTTPESILDLKKKVLEGDLSIVMKSYEKEISAPIRNIFIGNLLRSILIQVQKSKVDLDIAMSSLDKLMKSNELNFEFLAVIPTVGLLYLVFRGARDCFQRFRGKEKIRYLHLINLQLITFHRFCCTSDERDGCNSLRNLGFLILNLFELFELIDLYIGCINRKHEFIELMEPEIDILLLSVDFSTKRHSIERIQRIIGLYE